MTILIVEDDDGISSFLKRGLEAEGYSARVARDGVAGLALAARGDWRLMILDLQIPGRDGLDLCRDVRAAGIKAPILMLTARDTLDDKVIGLKSGADDYLAKPFAFEELLARVAALLRRGADAAVRPRRLEVGDLAFDLQSLQVRRGERPIELTSKELAILELMMSQPGAVFSRERILSAAWGVTSDPQTNVVEVFIARLRKKIDGAGGPKLLHTVRGRGYRLAEGAPDPA